MSKINITYILFITCIFINSAKAADLNIFSLGLYDFNKQKNEAIDFRFEKNMIRLIRFTLIH